MNLLINAMVHRGADSNAMEAKVFGGGVVGATRILSRCRAAMNAEFVIANLEGAEKSTLWRRIFAACARARFSSSRLRVRCTSATCGTRTARPMAPFWQFERAS